MRFLIMFRHAKSDWHADYGDDDRLRPLSRPGRRAAQTMGRFLDSVGQLPDRAIVSPATRARQTLELAMRAGSWDCPVQESHALYGEVEDVFNAVRQQAADARVLLIVGTSRPGRAPLRRSQVAWHSACPPRRCCASSSMQTNGQP